MAVWAEIVSSQLATARRFDSEYWHPRFISLECKLARIHEEHKRRIADVAKSVECSAFYPSIAEAYGTDGVPFIRVADVKEILLDPAWLVRVPNDLVAAYPTLRTADPGDVLITKGG